MREAYVALVVAAVFYALAIGCYVLARALFAVGWERNMSVGLSTAEDRAMGKRMVKVVSELQLHPISGVLHVIGWITLCVATTMAKPIDYLYTFLVLAALAGFFVGLPTHAYFATRQMDELRDGIPQLV